MINILRKIYTALLLRNAMNKGVGYIVNKGRGKASMSFRVFRAESGKWEDSVTIGGGIGNKVKSLLLK